MLLLFIYSFFFKSRVLVSNPLQHVFYIMQEYSREEVFRSLISVVHNISQWETEMFLKHGSV